MAHTQIKKLIGFLKLFHKAPGVIQENFHVSEHRLVPKYVLQNYQKLIEEVEEFKSITSMTQREV